PPSLVILFRDRAQIMLAAGNAETPPNPNRTEEGYCWQAYVHVEGISTSPTPMGMFYASDMRLSDLYILLFYKI
ncbi:MAG: hypothetical protein ACTSQV_03095, partial [Alphaproteobacteria bacterium]